jgi:hypothetical protein
VLATGATNRIRPWESTTVQTLANKLGKDKNIVPMMIEGPTGCILASVGEERDQKAATEGIYWRDKKHCHRYLNHRHR